MTSFVQPKATIYLLDKSLEKDAENLKKFLESEHPTKMCLHSINEVGEDIAKAHLHYATCSKFNVESKKRNTGAKITIKSFKDLNDLMQHYMIPYVSFAQELASRDSDSDSDYDCQRHCFLRGPLPPPFSVSSTTTETQDVVVILGHASVFHFRPSATEDLLIALTKLQPTIVAFLSCSGGNSRHGPIMKIAQLLHPKSIVGFYQRRVYVEELCETSLVVGLRNFLFMMTFPEELLIGETVSMAVKTTKLASAHEIADRNKRLVAIKAFGCAELGECDPTVFVNDSLKPNVVEILYNAGFNPAKDSVIPASYFQLAMYHPMLLDSDMWYPVMNSIAKDSAKSFVELNKHSVEEIKKCKLNKIIPMILEIGLMKLYKKSLDHIETGTIKSWKRIDHLQFLLAMLRGHWGINRLTVIREWASFHLMEMMKECKESLDDTDIHKYKLCCVCYSLLCKHHFLRFVHPKEEYHKFEILAYTTLKDSKQYYKVTFKGYIWKTDTVHVNSDTLSDICPSFDKGTVLPWYEMYQHCDYIEKCVNLFNHDIWKICSYVGGDISSTVASATTGTAYEYKLLDFKLAMTALADHFLHDRTSRTTSYHVKNFNNCCNEKKAMMSIFDPKRMQYFTTEDDYTFIEMRVVVDKSDLKAKKKEDPIKVLLRSYTNHVETDETLFAGDDISKQLNEYKDLEIDLKSCRFIFAKYTEPSRIDQPIRGVLFYTDNHYGHNLIDFHHLPQLKDLQVPSKLVISCLKPNFMHCSDYISTKQNKSFMNKLFLLCKPCLYAMQEIMIDNAKKDSKGFKFPFVNVGKLTLYHQDKKLKRLDLEPATI